MRQVLVIGIFLVHALGKSAEGAGLKEVKAEDDNHKPGEMVECGNVKHGNTPIYGSATFKSTRQKFRPQCVYYFPHMLSEAEKKRMNYENRGLPEYVRLKLGKTAWSGVGAEKLLTKGTDADVIEVGFLEQDEMHNGTYSESSAQNAVSFSDRNLFNYKNGALKGSVEVTDTDGFPGKTVKLNLFDPVDKLTGTMTFSIPGMNFNGGSSEKISQTAGPKDKDLIAELNAKLPKHAAELKACVSKVKTLPENPESSVDIVISPEGKVVHENVIKTNVLLDAVNYCILDKTKAWTFSKNPKRPRFAVDYRYTF